MTKVTSFHTVLKIIMIINITYNMQGVCTLNYDYDIKVKVNNN